MPVIVKNEISSKQWRQTWARLIQKIYEVDPLICPKCQGEMRIIAFIEDDHSGRCSSKRHRHRSTVTVTAHSSMPLFP